MFISLKLVAIFPFLFLILVSWVFFLTWSKALKLCQFLREGNGTPLQYYFAWKIPWTEELGRLQSMGSLRVGNNWATSLSLFTFMHWRRKWQPTPVFLPGESQGQGRLVGCRLWGRRESDTKRLSSSTSSRIAISSLSGTRDWCCGKQFFHRLQWTDSFGMIQMPFMYCVLYFYCYYISFTSEHQALDPRG